MSRQRRNNWIYQARKKAAFHGAAHQCNERKAGVSEK